MDFGLPLHTLGVIPLDPVAGVLACGKDRSYRGLVFLSLTSSGGGSIVLLPAISHSRYFLTLTNTTLAVSRKLILLKLADRRITHVLNTKDQLMSYGL